jgi:hypothetical protein
MTTDKHHAEVSITAEAAPLRDTLTFPTGAAGIVLFAHGCEHAPNIDHLSETSPAKNQ